MPPEPPDERWQALRQAMLRLLMATLCCIPALPLGATEVLEETIERDYPIEPGSKFTLQNGDGSVLIYGAAALSDVDQHSAVRDLLTRLGRIDLFDLALDLAEYVSSRGAHQKLLNALGIQYFTEYSGGGMPGRGHIRPNLSM